MSKLFFWLADILVVLLSVLYLTLSFLSVSHSVFDPNLLLQYSDNWNSGAITDIIKLELNNKNDKNIQCPKEYKPFISNYYPSTLEGCDCTNSDVVGLKGNIFKYKCTASHILDKCKIIFPNNSILLNKWKDNFLCIKRTNKNYFEYELEVEAHINHKAKDNKSKRCKSGYKLCGLLDTNGNRFCIEESETCPINDLFISNSFPENLNKNIYKIINLENKEKSNNNLKLYFTNQLTNSPIIANITVSTNNPVCSSPIDNTLGRTKYLLNSNFGTPICKTKVDQKTFDPRFFIIDTDNLYSFYGYNNVLKNSINKLPKYNLKQYNSLPGNSYSNEAILSSTSYYGLNQSCINNNRNEFNYKSIFETPLYQVENLNSRVYTLSILCILHFCMTLLFIIVYKVWIAKFNVSPKILFIFDFLNIAFLILITIYSFIIKSKNNNLLEPYINFFSNSKCTDKFTYYSFNLAYSPLLKVNKYITPIAIISIIETILLAINYTFYFCTNDAPFYNSIKYT